MKLLLLFFIAISLNADDTIELKVKGKAAQSFTKESSSLRSTNSINEVVYYRNGIKSEKSKFIASREIFISFGKKSSVEYENFAKNNNLHFLREINSLYKTALYRVQSSQDIIEVCNKLNRLESVRSAQPNFKRFRELR